MTHRLTQYVFVASALAAAVTVAGAQQKQAPFDVSNSTTELVHAHMLEIADQIADLRASFGRQAHIDRLTREYEALSQMLGGDDPANAGRATSGPQALSPAVQGPQMLVNPVCSGAATTTNVPGTTGVISVGGVTPATFTCSVSGVGSYLWDVDVHTSIVHTKCADIDMTLSSPGGTTITLSTDNGSTHDNVFNGTAWNDDINATTMDSVYANNVTETPLNAEGRLAAFRGEDPNGTWKLTITDDLFTDSGSLAAWSLDITTATAPTETIDTYSDTPAIVISTGAAASYPDTQIVSGAGTVLTGLQLYLQVAHTFCGDLDITLTPPFAGVGGKVTTDNGNLNDNIFNGTTFDPDSSIAITDIAYANNVVVVTCAPEGSFDDWLGQNPNGIWMLTVADDAMNDGGLFNRWDLIVTTDTSAVATAGPTNFAGTTGAIPDAGSGGPAGPLAFTAVAAGLGTYLWDVDLDLVIDHTFGADLDLTLTSPAGTVVTVSTDNGVSQAFNGTLFDDDANAPATDETYTSGSASTPLSPEGRLSAFRGENPNGTWTLSISDDTAGNGGSLNAWSLGLSTIPTQPTMITTSLSSSPGIVIPTTAPPLIFTDDIVASGLGTSLTRVDLEIEITHSFSADLDITLTSPAGTVVTVTTDNGSLHDNIYGDGAGDGTLFDQSSTAAPSDYVFTNLVVATLLAPEGSFDNFDGQDPNGTWRLTVSDDLNFDGGTWHRWRLDLSTCATPVTVTNCQLLPTATQGCNSVASFFGSPSASSAAAFTITFGGMNSLVNGVVYYGITGSTILPWSAESKRCVDPPKQRLNGVPGAFGSTQGTLGGCNGQLSFDFNNIIQGTFPGMLGVPMSAGQQVDVQAWQRDPASVKTTTNLTDALSFVVGS